MTAAANRESATAAHRSPVVLITGASSGIGHALARRFAARGWTVFASMRSPGKGESLRAEARERGWSLHTPRLDVTDEGSVTVAVGELLAETGGRVDLLINNAGYYLFGPLEETSTDELRAQFETNVLGVHRVTRAVLPAMRQAGRGRIVILGSLSGLVTLPVVGPYHASKWALEALAESWRYELAPLGIAVVLIEPGPFKTLLHDNEVRAAASGGPDSPYCGLFDAYRREAAKLRRAELPALIDTIERAATVRRPRLRWPVGPNAFSASCLRRLTPDWLYELVMRVVFRQRRRVGSAAPH
jgi:NAD(P)-dependent dehydrogenase (short-subunit alcohol dehydrogenase family)